MLTFLRRLWWTLSFWRLRHDWPDGRVGRIGWRLAWDVACVMRPTPAEEAKSRAETLALIEDVRRGREEAKNAD